ncbi:DNA-binding transcriptional regulator, AcrR family [Pseudarcicella hirudinis]|uniref:DNA-binding transcriptional regulator, AcrR family n=1 Tax=Pseudarcicella hirudinis TaxID=1079859 RepID=A0A1I5MRM3_9BACT|nr:TetR family transcriptional regulator [Pseudarcicella hirudinis]SFP12173.1 DNA-binding transcriptional regulator, AcrR family [Pseudarcicella hirudinis]
MKTEKKIEADLSTEQKIMEAARKVFTQKGYSGTRTRDIAEEAGINLALLNYYFRSKEKLFQQVMIEKIQQFFSVIAPIFMDASSDLETKVERIASNYIDMLSENPDLPIFVLSEIRNNKDQIFTRLNVGKLVQHSSLVQQLKEKRPDINPLHFIINILGMLVFPFVAQPVLVTTSMTDPEQFKVLMEERKRLIPIWIKTILSAE